ncbi:MAG: SMC family ATPase, partial [Methanothrix sp.]
MHLNKLAMRNFKKFRRADLEFSDGLTGILGSNGAGKSTIVEAIAWALYGNRASSLKREFIRNSRARESDAVEVALTISLGKQELAIHRAMRGKGMTPEAHLALDGQRIATGAKEVDGKLEEILKISYQDFMKTFYARQKDLDNLLKEGAMGKREYLLKLLGLEDIKEGALDLIKADKAALEEEKSRLAGALTEIGDVSGRLERAALDLQAAEKELEEAERNRAGLAGIEEEGRRTLEAFEEKKRRHETLRERRVSLEAGGAELKEKAGAEQRRLAGIDLSRKRLQEIQPLLERLAGVRQRLEVLEPQRAAFEDSARSIASCRAALEAERRALVESQKRLLELEKDAAERKALLPMAHKQSVETDLTRNLKLQEDLGRARARLAEIAHCREEEVRRKEELSILSRQKEKQREQESLQARKSSLEERLALRRSEWERVREENDGLGDLEQREALLLRQDRDLDRLNSELSRILA